MDFKLKEIVVLTMCFCTVICFGQDREEILINKVDSLIENKVKSKEILRKSLREFLKDSVSINLLIQEFESKKYKNGEVFILNRYGVFCRNRSRYKKAIILHKEALVKAKLCKDLEQEIETLNMLGVVYRRTDEIQTALDYHQEALKLTEKIDVKTKSLLKSKAVSLNSMGNIYLTLEQYDLAIGHFTKSLSIEKKVENNLGLAINYHNIGYAKEALSMLDQALDDYKISLSFNREIQSKLGITICKYSIGRVYIKQEKIDQAVTIIESCLQTAIDLGDNFHLSAVYNSLGWAYLKQKNIGKSLRFLNKALSLGKENDLRSTVAEANEHLSNLYEQQGEFDKALAFYKSAVLINKDLIDQKKFQYVNDLMVRYETEKITNQVNNLEKENELVKSNLRRTKMVWIISSLVLLLISVVVYILYRQQILKDEKKILTLEQDMLRSQMNPHFIFNSLNAIKQYIISNERKNAVYYLNKFAKLIRKILDASRLKEVSLADELETIDLYMSIENIRFSNSINYEVFIDKNINLDTVKIPSLVLQPFLENAIWHGLSSKKGDKNITLNISKLYNNRVSIVIWDNGIGRAKAAEIALNKIVKKKSIGITITKQRLARFDLHYKLSFTDLFDSKNAPEGTKVELVFSIKKSN